MIEIVVVMLLVSILIAVVAPSINGPRKASTTSTQAIAAEAVWRGVMMYRLDNQGLFPTAAEMAPASGDYGAGVVAPGSGRRYIRPWPANMQGVRIGLVVKPAVAGGFPSPLPSTTAVSADRSVLVYSVGANRLAGWIAAYNSSGKLVYRRSVNSGAAVGVPVG